MLSKAIIAPISLSLAVLLITPSVLKAVTLSDIAMSTSTSAGTWSDPLGGGTYMYGGDFKMKLKTTSSFAPLLQFKLPSASVGCSGISINGGFLSFLGLDKLQDELSNAGSSLMFGIILGMEFTLPAVSAVFAKIRAWANALQALMQNGCNIGRSISAGSASTKSIYDSQLSKSIGSTFTEMDSFIGGGEGALTAIKNLAECDGNPANPKCSLEKNANVAMGLQIKENAKDNQTTGVSAEMISKGTNPLSTSDAVATAFDLSSFYSSKKITCANISTTSITANDMLVDQLKYIFFGDIGVDDASVREIESRIVLATCKFDNTSMSKDLSSSITTGTESTFPVPTYSKISPLISSPTDAAEMLVYGFERLNEKYASVTNNIVTIPDRRIIYLDAPTGKDDNANSTSRARAVYVSSKSMASSPIVMTWDGAFKESLKGIRSIVDSQTGQSWRLSASYSEYDTGAVGTVTTPLLIPGVKKYANIIARLEKKNNGATPQTEQLKVKLAKYNAIMFSEGLMNGIQSRVMELSNGIKGNPTAINDYLVSISMIEKEVRILLKEMGKDLSKDDLIESFKTLEKEQALESVKAER